MKKDPTQPEGQEPNSPPAGEGNASAPKQDAHSPAGSEPASSTGEPGGNGKDYAADPRIAPSLRTKTEPAPADPRSPSPTVPAGSPTDGQPAHGRAPEPPGATPPPTAAPKAPGTPPEPGQRDPERQSRFDRRIGELLSQSREKDRMIAELQARLGQPAGQPPGQPEALPRGGRPSEPRQPQGPTMPLASAFVNPQTGDLDEAGYARAVQAFVSQSVQTALTQVVPQAVGQAQTEREIMAAEQAFGAREQSYAQQNPEYAQLLAATADAFTEPVYERDASGRYVEVDRQPRNPELFREIARRGDPRLAHATMRDPAYWVVLQGPDLRAALDAEVQRLNGAPQPHPQAGPAMPPAGPRPVHPTYTPPAPPPRPAGGGGGAPPTSQRWTEESVRGKNPRELAKHMAEIDESIQRGTFFRP